MRGMTTYGKISVTVYKINLYTKYNLNILTSITGFSIGLILGNF